MKHTILIAIFFTSHLLSAQETLLLQQPTLSKDKIAFTYANDLWIADRIGGEAIRITSDEGNESFPHFSEDGKLIAFSAQYDGNTDVYVVSVAGGTPKRLTFHPSGDFVQGWTPEGSILFSSSRKGHPTQTNTFYTIGLDGGLPQKTKIERGAYGEISSDGSHIAYTPITSWDPEWRNYRGGQAMPIWIVNLNDLSLVRTPQLDHERHLYPVWYDNEVYYLSERDYTSNIWAFNPITKQERQITFHKKYDVKSLDAGPDGIVYEQGGKLHIIDMNTKDVTHPSIVVKGDLNFARERWEEVSARQLSNAYLSPTGKRAIFEHRGEIFTFPKEKGSWKNLTKSSGAADRAPSWSPDGSKIAYFSDQNGEYELVVADQNGKIQKSYPIETKTFYFTPDWSPDSDHLVFTDTDYNIHMISLESGEITTIDSDTYAHPNRTINPVWSPDGNYIAYTKQQDSHFKSVYIYDLQTMKASQVVDGLADAFSPVWDKSQKYLYFLASTDYSLQSGWLDMSSYNIPVSRSLNMVLLQSDLSSPYLPISDEEKVEKADAKKEEKKEKKDVDDDKSLPAIDFADIKNRTIALNIPTGNYLSLTKGKENQVLILENPPGNGGNILHHYNHKKDKLTTLGEGISIVIASHDRNSILVYQNNAYKITASDAPIGKSADVLKINAKLKVDPKSEYLQMYKEAWRFMRDFLYVNNVHGAPWDEVYSWYRPWVDHIRHRSDLNYVIDIISGEVAVGHSYVSGGDLPDIDRVPVGLLGCDFEVVGGKLKIGKIYNGGSWNPDATSPLSLPGLSIKEGDFLHSINGISLEDGGNPYELLQETANRSIYITTSTSGNEEDVSTSLIKPLRSENALRTFSWIENNRKKVDKLSGGKLAYVYVPNTSGRGYQYFNRYYFSQQDKEGVIVDERNNGGGSAADYMIDVMKRKPFGYFNSKSKTNRPWTSPIAGIYGPKVMIINERAGSGGDLLPYMFKEAEIGPLVGTRTWGGLVGTWDTPRFIDGGRMVAPRGGFYDINGKWAVEGEGVAPDIEVIQEPKEVIKGNDPQLEKAVSTALDLLKTERFVMKPEPPAPIRWKRPEGWKSDN